MSKDKQQQARRKRTPDAFGMKFPKIERVPTEDALKFSANARVNNAQVFAMGKLFIEVCPPTETQEIVMSVNHPHRLPTWNEMVWIRYMLLPAEQSVALILPPLGDYINYDGGRAGNTMTMQTVIPDAKEWLRIQQTSIISALKEATKNLQATPNDSEGHDDSD